MTVLDRKLSIHGHVTASLINEKTGDVDLLHSGDNLVVDGGLLNVAKYLAGAINTPIIQMGCGTGVDWPGSPGTQSTLETVPGGAVTYTFLSGDITYAQPSTGSATATFNGNWTSSQNNFTIAEVGLFASGPLLIARYVFPSPYIPKTSSQTLKIVYVLTVSAS